MHVDSLTTLAMKSRQVHSPEQGTTAGCYYACYYDISCDLSCILLPIISGRHRSTCASISTRASEMASGADQNCLPGGMLSVCISN